MSAFFPPGGSGGRGAVSLIPSILVGVTLCVGPVASALTNRYGCRAVTIAGAGVAAAGLAISAAAPSVVFLYLSIGLGTGELGTLNGLCPSSFTC